MADKRGVAIAAGAAGLLGLAALAFAGDKGPAKKAKPKRPLTPKERAIVLAVRYARLFGVPTSLPIAIMAAGGWKQDAHVPNVRGGAHGFMYITLDTAKDLVRRFPALTRKHWPKFDGSWQSLHDPETNIALGTYQVSLQWKRFKSWYPAALSYYTGAGRMDAIIKAGGGKLPAQLPADIAKMKAAYDRVRVTEPYVKKALLNEGSRSSGVGAAGQTTRANQMAAQFDTLDKARRALGKVAETLKDAYPIADSAPLLAIGLRKALHSRIDGVNVWAQKVYRELGTTDPPTLLTRRKVALAVVQASDVIKETDAAANDPELGFWRNFVQALQTILTGAGRFVEKVLPDWALPVGLAIGGGALLIALKK